MAAGGGRRASRGRGEAGGGQHGSRGEEWRASGGAEAGGELRRAAREQRVEERRAAGAREQGMRRGDEVRIWAWAVYGPFYTTNYWPTCVLFFFFLYTFIVKYEWI